MMTLEQWIRLAGLKPDEPLPPELRKALQETAAEVHRLAYLQELKPEIEKAVEEAIAEDDLRTGVERTCRLMTAPRPPAHRTATAMAKAAGLTAGAVRIFRAEAMANSAAVATVFWQSSGAREKMEVAENRVAALLGVDPRTLRRWRSRSRRRVRDENI
jgi:hypothetical protein